MIKIKLDVALLVALVVFITACSTVAVTNRKQVKLIPNSTMFATSFQQYDEFLKEHKTITGTTQANQVKNVGAKIQKAVEKYFADIPAGKKDIFRPDVKEPEQTREKRKIVYDNVQLPAVIMSFHMPAQGTPDYYALGLLQNLLSAGKSSRLYKSLVDEQQLAVQTGAFPVALEDPGLFVVYAFANLGKEAEEVEKAMVTEIEKIKSGDISDREFQKLQNQFETEFYTRNATMQGIALSLADYHTFFWKCCGN
ncbi:MAG: insulinase family protein [Chloroflexia bacterium]|nr:insulinase family protein [Chloroflexia bacterium]